MEGNYDPSDPFSKDKNDRLDTGLGLTRDDYRGLGDPSTYGPKDEKPGNIMEPPVPELAEILAAPRPPKIGETQLVSVAVTDDVPLKDVLIELARLAEVDIELDSGISGGISFRAKDRPFNEVIERIADLAGLRYTMKNNVLRVERDVPYIEMYSLDFLNIERSSDSTVTVNTSVLSTDTGGGGGGEGLNTGSDTSITTKAESDFWKQFEEGVKRILSYQPVSRVSNVTVAVQPTPPQLPLPAQSDASGGAASTPPAAPSAPPASGAVSPVSEPFYIINRQAATLTVSATEQQHDLMKEFIRRVQLDSTSQVLIEAKIVEVQLDQQYQSGINWTRLGASSYGLTVDYSQFPTPVGATTTPTLATFDITKNDILRRGIDLDAMVKMVEVFGTTRTLSSPRLHATNNQQAVLTFARNQPYYTLTVQQTSTPITGGGSTTTTTVNSQLHTIPIGIILAMQPSINRETNEVTLNIRPTLSRLIDFVDDPAIAYILATSDVPLPGVSSEQAPIVEVRELDSILKLKSGQVMVIGGLMEDKGSAADQGVPGVSSVPWFGNLFKNVNKSHQITELVIFIRATIVGSSGDAHNADKGVYEKFTRDPRPLQF